MYLSRFSNILLLSLCTIELSSQKVIATESSGENIIIKICESSLTKEMNDAGKKPPPGMADYTCNCFYTKVISGASIDNAQSLCKQNASKKYNLEG